MTTNLLLLLVLFQLKHFISDYPLQSNSYMLGKFRADWGFFRPLLAHSAVHAQITFWICYGFGASPGTALALAAFNGTVHFAMDRLKAGPKYMGRWKPLTGPEFAKYEGWVSGWKNGDNILQEFIHAKRQLRDNTLFWNALGFDQLVHHLTDLACVWWLVSR